MLSTRTLYLNGKLFIKNWAFAKSWHALHHRKPTADYASFLTPWWSEERGIISRGLPTMYALMLSIIFSLITELFILRPSTARKLFSMTLTYCWRPHCNLLLLYNLIVGLLYCGLIDIYATFFLVFIVFIKWNIDEIIQTFIPNDLKKINIQFLSKATHKNSTFP